jgi:hypothetical protein
MYPLLFATGLFAGLIAAAVTRKPPKERETPVPPTIAGQQASRFVSIDFDKRYDIVTRPRSGGEPVVFRRCKILGLTGEDVREVGRWSSAGLVYGWMHRWLALELEDGRAVYLPTDSVLTVEQS